MNSAVSLAIAGLGGYAATIRKQVLGMGEEGPLKLEAVCEPALEAHEETVGELRGLGVRVYRSLEEMLLEPVEAVWLPVPIQLHRPMTEAALGAGKAVMCEKPAAGSVDDVDAMIAARDQTGRPAAVGFQEVHQRSTVELKRMILAGAIGKVTRASVQACWPRDSVYYGRSSWAGALQRGGEWVMDSPAQNALAHQVAMTLFLLGEELYSSATPVGVESELYRARAIENYDTCSMRLEAGGARVIVALTHACRGTVGPIIRIEGERGSVRGDRNEWRLTAGAEEKVMVKEGNRRDMFERFAKLVRGEADERAVATLEVARAHVVAINGASEATAVKDVDESLVEGWINEKGGEVRTIRGIEEAIERCAVEGKLLHETGVAWAQAGGRMDLRGYGHFAGPRFVTG